MNTSTFRQITKKILTAYLVTVHQIKKIIVSVYLKLKTMATTTNKKEDLINHKNHKNHRTTIKTIFTIQSNQKNIFVVIF